MNKDTRAAMAAIFNQSGKPNLKQEVKRDFAEAVKATNDPQIYTDPTPLTDPHAFEKAFELKPREEEPLVPMAEFEPITEKDALWFPPMPEPENKPALTFPEPVVSKVLTSKGVGELSPADFGDPDTWAAKFAYMAASGHSMENLSFEDVNFVSLMQAPIALEFFQVAANYYRELYLKYKALAPKA